MRAILDNAPMVYLSTPVADLSLPRPVPAARYAVMFYMRSSRRYRALALAWILLNFFFAIREVHPSYEANVLSLGYEFLSDGVVAVLFLGRRYKTAYDNALARARMALPNYKTFVDRYPVSFWPRDIGDREWDCSDVVIRCMLRHTRSAFVLFKPSVTTAHIPFSRALYDGDPEWEFHHRPPLAEVTNMV